MLQSSLSLGSRGTCPPSDDTTPRQGLGGFLRALFVPSAREKLRPDPLDPLSDHILQDIGLSRADLQALTL